jgi:hypothetical protein
MYIKPWLLVAGKESDFYSSEFTFLDHLFITYWTIDRGASRENGKYGLLEYTQTKSVVIK